MSASPSSSPSSYNFLRGHPNPGLLPLAEMKSILQKTASDDGGESSSSSLLTSLNYLPDDQGDPRCLEELRAFLDRHTQHDASDDEAIATINTNTTTHLFLTHGVSHGLELLCATQTQPGDVVWMERPTYFLAADIFRSHHMQIEALPMKRQRAAQPSKSNDKESNRKEVGGGLDVDALEERLRNGSPPPRMIYIIPTHHNPTGDTMSLRDRIKLGQLAEIYNFWVFADEVYHLLDWRDTGLHGPRPARMATISPKCISVSSFTKIFCPGIRFGWIEAWSSSRYVIDSLMELGYIKSQGGCAPLMGELMRVAMSDDLCDSALVRLNAAYKERSALLCRILQTEPRIRIHKVPLGGFFVWISFDGIDDASELLPICQTQGVKFLAGKRCGSFVDNPGDDCWEADWCRRSARLCFADMDVVDIEEGAKRLVQCYRTFMRERSK